MWQPLFQRLDAWERPLCVALSKWHEIPSIRSWFGFCSWLGNGPAWGVLIAWMCWSDFYGVGLDLLIVTAINLVLYKILKSRSVRRRPFVAHSQVKAGTIVLDEFSFPSGHTLHAVAVLATLYATDPVMALWLAPWVGMIMASRVVLGLHYPSDVLAGCLLGIGVSQIVLG